MSFKNIYYSDKYTDEKYEYRHVMLPKELAKQVPKTHLMSEEEWRRLGVQQSLGWVHYMIHEPGKLFATKEYIEGLLLENYGHINKPGTNRKPENPTFFFSEDLFKKTRNELPFCRIFGQSVYFSIQ